MGGILELGASSLLAHLPGDGGHSARGAAASHKADGGVAALELAGDVVEGLDLADEGLGALEGAVLGVDHNVTGAGHVVLVETLDVHADVVTGLGSVDTLVVHLDSEDLASAGGAGGVGGHEDDILAGVDEALLDTAGQNVADTLDLVDARDGAAHGGVGDTNGGLGKVVEGVPDGGDGDLGLGGGDDDLCRATPSGWLMRENRGASRREKSCM